MKIFLVNPACLDVRITDDDAMSIPIGLYYIGSLMLDRGVDTRVINLAPIKTPVDYLIELVKSERPDIIGFSVLNANRNCAIDAAIAVKKLNPKISIVFGGAAPTFIPEYFFRICPALDYIVKGEGEETFIELLSFHLGKLNIKEIKGLIFRDNGSIVENSVRPLISNLDSLPHPAKYFAFQHISLSRGCPGRCTFCGSPDFWGRGKVRFHSANWFVDEMELLVKRGISHFFVSDDTFTMKKKLVIDVCQQIIARFINQDIKITWAAISRVDFIDEEILMFMRKAGCIQISFGVESGSEEIRKTLGKPFKNETIIRAFKLTASFGILPRAYFIYGAPGESEHSINQSVDLIEQIEPLSMVSYMLVIFPGTALYSSYGADDIIWEQRIEDIPWFEIDPNLNFDQVKKFGASLRSAFYSNVHHFALNVRLVDNQELYPYHADFLSRLAMTFSHGDYSVSSNTNQSVDKASQLQKSDIYNSKVKHQDTTAKALYERALSYYPDSRAYLGLAMLMQKQRDFQGSVAVIKEAFENILDINSDTNSPTKRQLTLCMAVSLMNMAKFREALELIAPFSHYDEIKPYIHACQSRI
ncbi:MAG: B12-binding domain-containing radical SAM protein [Desulfamplus sp.]|nr:B12-binding domain-containing radical SAM protein [Desulfamplus sp.]